jgi:hypothetical protein
MYSMTGTFRNKLRARMWSAACTAAVCAVAISLPAGAAEGGDNASRSFLAMPFFFYTTDTEFGYGGAGALTYRAPGARPSSLMASLIHTTKHQFQAGTKWMHNVPGNRYRLIGEIQYNKFPQDFYGLGNDTSGKNPVTYTPEYTLAEGSIERSISGDLRIRALLFLRNQALVDRGKFDAFPAKGIPWAKGRLDAGPGIALLWDSRDNVNAALRGSLLQVEYRGSLLRDRGKAYSSLLCEAKVFRSPLPGCISGSMFQYRDVRGDAPFYLLPSLGGAERLRGYAMNRFVGRCALLVQEDLRFPIYKKIGGCVFAAAGRVSDTRRELFDSGYHASGGAGLRYFINREDGLVVRLDGAFGDGSSGTYITFGEAF